MKTTFQKTNKLLIAMLLLVFMGTKVHGQIPIDPDPLPDSLKQLKLCDASFKDMLPLILLPANVNMANLVAFAPAYKPLGTFNYYYWDMGDGTKDTGSLVLHNYAKTGKYLVTLISHVEQNGIAGFFTRECSSSQWVSIGIIDTSNICDATFAKIPVTPYSTINRVDLSSKYKNYASYDWDFGDSTKGAGSQVAHYYTKPGDYLVTLTITDSLCKDTKTMWVNNPVGNIYYPWHSASCKANIITAITRNTATFYDQPYVIQTFAPINVDSNSIIVPDGSYETLAWDFGDGLKDTGSQVSHEYTKAGKYIVTLIKSAYHNPCFGNPACFAAPILDCVDTSFIEVVIGELSPTCKSDLSISINGKTINIQDNNVLNAANNVYYENRYWDFGDSTSEQALGTAQVSHTYKKGDVYRIMLVKTIYQDPCPVTKPLQLPLIKCAAMPMLICRDTAYYSVWIGDCKANFITFIEDSTVTVLVNPISIVFGTLPVYKIDPVEMITAPSSMYSKLDFGDGSFEESNVYNYKTTHTYAKKGDYTICLYVATVPDSVLPYTKLSYYCNDRFCKTITISDSVSDPLVASIYPNPASDYMTVSIKNNFNKMDLRLYDQTGKLKKEVFEIQSNTKEIDTNGLEDGLYFYTLSDGENIVLKGKIAVSK